MAGEEILITRHDKAVARIIPEGRKSVAEIARVVEGLKALQKETAGKRKAPGKWSDFKPLVEEGLK